METFENSHEIDSHIRSSGPQSPTLTTILTAPTAALQKDLSSSQRDFLDSGVPRSLNEKLNEKKPISIARCTSEEEGEVEKIASEYEDPFGNEEDAEVKYKTMTWL
jgi:hypothetical protein